MTTNIIFPSNHLLGFVTFKFTDAPERIVPAIGTIAIPKECVTVHLELNAEAYITCRHRIELPSGKIDSVMLSGQMTEFPSDCAEAILQSSGIKTYIFRNLVFPDYIFSDLSTNPATRHLSFFQCRGVEKYLLSIGSIKDLTTLSLEDCGLQSCDLEPLMPLKKLEALNLKANDIDDDLFSKFICLDTLIFLSTPDGLGQKSISALKKAKRLRHLRLGYIQPGISLKDLGNLISLENLELEWPLTTEQYCDLSAITTLRTLQICSQEFQIEHLSCIDNCPELSRLVLHVNSLRPENLQKIKERQNLRELIIHSPYLEPHSLWELSTLTQLERLQFSSYALDDSKIEELARLTNLKSLTLNETKVTSHGLMELRNRIPQCRVSHLSYRRRLDSVMPLTHGRVYTKENEIWVPIKMTHWLLENPREYKYEGLGPDLTDLTRLATVCPEQITELELHQTLGDDRAAFALANCKNLWTLVTHGGTFTEEFLKVLAELLSVRKVVFRNNPTAGFDLTKHFTSDWKLLELDLRDTRLPETAVGRLATMTTLKHLDVVRAGLTRDQVEELQSALPDCTVISEY